MQIKEFRLVLPFSIDEYQRGQLYSVAEMSKNETGGGEGVEIVRQEPFTSTTLKPGKKLSGIYTQKIYRLKSKVPYFFRKMFPDSAFILYEEAWNAYPYTKTVVTNPDYMKENFRVCVESFHASDRGEQTNALGLSKDQLKKREVVYLDISDDKYLKKSDHNDHNNVGEFTSERTGRGPLTKGWARKHRPIMCSYKVVTVYFKWFGLQNRVESTIMNSYPRLFVKFHRETFCWIDRWYDLTLEEVRAFEEETASKLKNQLEEGSIKGMTAAEEGSERKKTSSESE
uniref:Phosphatidylinositol transfer protein n=1 Tax=Panagrolaimus superbus TaxID=310955 RepID=A0A914YXM8_9BILA